MIKKIILILITVISIICVVILMNNWLNPINNPAYNSFLEGNKLVEEQKIEESLSKYKEAMRTSDDLNIKKNYEIVLKKNQDDPNKDNKQKNQENENNQKNEEQKKNQEQKANNQENKKEEELRAILQRLEGNEKQALKNNEKVKMNNGQKKLENRW